MQDLQKSDVYYLGRGVLCASVYKLLKRIVWECVWLSNIMIKTCCYCHFLQYLVDCDEVIFMKEGCITERGSHEELMNLNGDYATIFNNLQLGETPHIEVPVCSF